MQNVNISKLVTHDISLDYLVTCIELLGYCLNKKTLIGVMLIGCLCFQHASMLWFSRFTLTLKH